MIQLDVWRVECPAAVKVRRRIVLDEIRDGRVQLGFAESDAMNAGARRD